MLELQNTGRRGQSQPLDFLPTNLKLGGGFDFIFDSYNKLAVSLEINKLLVPSPSEPITDIVVLVLV